MHGTLYMGVSGQCYFSSLLGGQSGNRWRCVQPCRLPFSLENGSGYDLSLKDLLLIQYLNNIKSIGVTSTKIEGRIKRLEFAVTIVASCNSALKGDKDFNKDYLTSVFSRSGFTAGYYNRNLVKICSELDLKKMLFLLHPNYSVIFHIPII